MVAVVGGIWVKTSNSTKTQRVIQESGIATSDSTKTQRAIRESENREW